MKSEHLSAVLAVLLIGFISYNSISERVRIQREIIEKPVLKLYTLLIHYMLQRLILFLNFMVIMTL